VEFHPCYSQPAHTKYGRVHLPVASKCNILCNYCDRKIGDCYHLYRPGVTSKVISPEEALEIVSNFVKEKWLKVVGIAGPGEPLFNQETFRTLELVGERYPELILCLSTNGLLLPRYVEDLHDLGVRTLTVTLNVVDPWIGEKIYSRVRWENKILNGVEGATVLLRNQLTGIKKAAELGIFVKINSVLIPGVNNGHLVEVARKAKSLGVYIQNITPLIPLGRFRELKSPSCDQVFQTRLQCEQIIRQFRLCKQCRADSVGIPGLEKGRQVVPKLEFHIET